MNCLSFNFYKNKIDIWVKNLKIIYSDSYPVSFEVLKFFNQYFTKTKLSERQEELGVSNTLLLNGKPLNTRTCSYFLVTPHYDLKTDLKLQSKSLILQYLHSFIHLQNISSELETINILLNSLSDELTNEDLPLELVVTSLSENSLTKMITPYLILDELISNEFDLSYEDIILFQLRLIKTVSKHELFNLGLVVLDLPIITKNILKETKELRNCISLITTSTSFKVDSIKDIHYISNNMNVDFANEAEIYEKIVNILYLLI